MDLAAVVDDLGVRRLFVLVANLPEESRYTRTKHGWTYRDEIAAVTAERIDVWGRAMFDLTRRVKTKPPFADLGEPLNVKHPARLRAKGQAVPEEVVEEAPPNRVSLIEAVSMVTGGMR